MGKTQTTQRWYTHISQLTQFMPPPETYKSEIGSQVYDVPGPGRCIRLTTHLCIRVRVYQVRDIRTGEADTYGGESTGIKSNVTRSRKLKG